MTGGPSPRRRAALLFLLAFAVYLANLRYTASYDSYATSLIPFRLLSGHGLTFPASDAAPPVAYSIVRSRTGSLVSFYPVVTALLATPLYAPVAWGARGAEPEVARVLMEKVAGAALAAASVALLFLALARLTSRRVATLLALAYAFGTLTWAVSSQALWLQTGSELLVSAALALVAGGLGTGSACALLGLVSGLLAANRPTDGVFALVFAVLAWRANRKGFPLFAAAAAAVGALALAWNLVHFGHPLGGYGLVFLGGGTVTGGPSLAGVAGLLVSNRGLLAVSPFLLALVAYRPSRARLPGTTLLLAAYAASLVIHGQPLDWWGGYCFGARYTLHGLPILFVALVEPVERLARRTAGAALLAAGGAVALLVEIAGAFFYPAGDSGNAGHGLWSPAKAPAIVAFAAGPRPPDFLGMIVPRLAMPPAPLPPRDASASYAWKDEPPPAWRPNERRRLRFAVENRGTVSWKGLGGFMNRGGVRVAVAWRREGGAGGEGVPALEATSWLALRVRAGRAATVDLDVQAPPDEGRYVLAAGLVQLGVAPFSSAGVPELRRDIMVVRPDDGVRWDVEMPAVMDPNRSGAARVRVVSRVPAAGVVWRWRRPGEPALRTDGPVRLGQNADGSLSGEIAVPTRLVSGEYVVEFCLVPPGRAGGVLSVSPSRRVSLRGDWAAAVSGRSH